MKIGVIADIHANFEAFLAVLRNLKEQKVKKLINCGDIVGYGPDPVKCLEMIMVMKGHSPSSLSDEEAELASYFKITSVMGNHDAGVINFTDISCFNRNAYEALLWTREQLEKDHFSFIKTIPMTLDIEGARFFHSTPMRARNWYYLDSLEMARESFGRTPELIFVGHTHKPYIFLKRMSINKVTGKFPGDREWKLDPANSYIINPGSIGQPRDGNYMPSFIIWDTEKQRIRMHRCDYDVMITQSSLAVTPLPYILSERLSLGK